MMIPHPRKLLTVALPIALVACFAGAIRSLVLTWASQPVYSFGFILPAISAYLVWVKRSTIRGLRVQTDAVVGLLVLGLALAMLAVGHVGALIVVQEASILVALVAFVLLRYGRAVLTALWFPIAYLLLGVPIWNQLIEKLQEPSQVLSGSIAVAFLRTLGVPALHDGTTIVLPNIALEVMRECSGVNQLVSMVAMTLPLSYVMLRGFPRRSLLVALGVAISYLSNGVRIALVGFLAYRGLGDGNLRSVHLLEGLAVSVVGYSLLFGCISLLARSQRPQPILESKSVETLPSPLIEGPSHRFHVAVDLAMVVVVLSVGVMLFRFHPADVTLRDDLSVFPSRIGDWTLDTAAQSFGDHFPAIDDAMVHGYPSPEGMRRFAAGDDELSRVYRLTTGERVRLFVGYHRSQREGKELTGDASALLAQVAAPVTIAVGGATVAVNEVVHDSSAKRRTLLYWYDVNGRIVSDVRIAKLYMLWDTLTRGRTNGAVIMLGWESPSGSAIDPSRQRVLELAKAVLPLLARYIPS